MLDCHPNKVEDSEEQATSSSSKLDQHTRDSYTILVIFLVVFVLMVWLIGASTPLGASNSGFQISVG